MSGLSGTPTGSGKAWRVDTGGRHRGSMKVTMLLVALVAAVPLTVMALGVDLLAYQQVMKQYAFLIILGFLALAYLPYLLRKRKDDAGWLRLEDGKLWFESTGRSEDLDLAGAELSLSRVSVGGQLFGSLLVAHAPGTGRRMKLFAHGAQLAPDAYNGGDASYPRDAWMLDRDAFRELLAELGGPASAERPAASAPQPGYRTPPAAPEQTFEVTMPKGVGLYVGAGFLPLLLMLDVLFVLKLPWAAKPLAAIGIFGVCAALTAGAGLPLWRALRKRRHGRVVLRFSDAALVLEGAKGAIFRADAPPGVEMLLWKDHWLHQRRYVRGAALRLTNARGETVTLGVSDPPAMRGGAETTSAIDFVLSADAGQALMEQLGV